MLAVEAALECCKASLGESGGSSESKNVGTRADGKDQTQKVSVENKLDLRACLLCCGRNFFYILFMS